MRISVGIAWVVALTLGVAVYVGLLVLAAGERLEAM